MATNPTPVDIGSLLGSIAPSHPTTPITTPIAAAVPAIQPSPTNPATTSPILQVQTGPTNPAEVSRVDVGDVEGFKMVFELKPIDREIMVTQFSELYAKLPEFKVDQTKKNAFVADVIAKVEERLNMVVILFDPDEESPDWYDEDDAPLEAVAESEDLVTVYAGHLEKTYGLDEDSTEAVIELIAHFLGIEAQRNLLDLESLHDGILMSPRRVINEHGAPVSPRRGTTESGSFISPRRTVPDSGAFVSPRQINNTGGQ